MKNKDVIVTGDMGFVGSYLRDAVRAPIGIDLKSGVDLSKFPDAERIFSDYNPRIIYHLAAITQVNDGLRDPHQCISNNIQATLNVLELARQYEARVVLMSSDKVYGDGLEKSEDSDLDAIYPYDVSKKCCEDIARSYIHTYNSDIVIARSCNIYGAGDPNLQRLIPALLHAVRHDEVLKIRSNGKQLREYIYVLDVVSALQAIAERGKSGEAYNIGTTEVMNALDVIHRFQCVTGIIVEYEVLDVAEHEISEQSLDSTKIRSLSWMPSYKFSDVIGDIYENSN